VGFDVLTTCQPSTVWCSQERLPAAAAQPAKARQSCSASDYYLQPPELRASVNLNKENQLIQPYVKYINAHTYKVAKLLSEWLEKNINLLIPTQHK
jgi:hypothetical protein